MLKPNHLHPSSQKKVKISFGWDRFNSSTTAKTPNSILACLNFCIFSKTLSKDSLPVQFSLFLFVHLGPSILTPTSKLRLLKNSIQFSSIKDAFVWILCFTSPFRSSLRKGSLISMKYFMPTAVGSPACQRSFMDSLCSSIWSASFDVISQLIFRFCWRSGR